MTITNKTAKPIKVPLPGGKTLFLGPGKLGQITPKAAKHPPLLQLVEVGDLEIDDSSDRHAATSSNPTTATAHGQNSNPTSSIRRTGDR